MNYSLDEEIDSTIEQLNLIKRQTSQFIFQVFSEGLMGLDPRVDELMIDFIGHVNSSINSLNEIRKPSNYSGAV